MTNPYPGDTNWPAEFNGCEVKGHWVGLDGTPIAGTITFSVSANFLVAQGSKTIVVPRALTVTLDADGKIDVTIPATDDPDIYPYGFTYSVKENWVGGRAYTITAPSNGIENLADLQGQSSIDPGAIYAGYSWSIIRGETREWVITVTLLDGSPVPGGLFSNPRSEWRQGLADTSPVIAVFGTTTSCPVVGTITVTGGVITITLDNSASKLLTVGKYYFDIWVDQAGEPFRVSPGIITVLQNTTIPE